MKLVDKAIVFKVTCANGGDLSISKVPDGYQVHYMVDCGPDGPHWEESGIYKDLALAVTAVSEALKVNVECGFYEE